MWSDQDLNYWFDSSSTVKPATLKNTKNGFQDQLSLDAGQEHSAILSNFIKLPIVIKILILFCLFLRPEAILHRFYCM